MLQTAGMVLSGLGSIAGAFGGTEQDKNTDIMNILARKNAQRSLNMYKDVSGMALPQAGQGLQSSYLLSDYLGLTPSNVGKGLQERGYGNPYMEGTDNTGFLTKRFGLDDFEADPGYQFRLEQGQKALDRMNAARGSFLGGGAIREGLRYNSGLASQEYGNAYDRFTNDQNNIYNRLMGMANAGRSSAAPYTGGTTAQFQPVAPQADTLSRIGQVAGDLGGGMYTMGKDKEGMDLLKGLIG